MNFSATESTQKMIFGRDQNHEHNISSALESHNLIFQIEIFSLFRFSWKMLKKSLISLYISPRTIWWEFIDITPVHFTLNDTRNFSFFCLLFFQTFAKFNYSVIYEIARLLHFKYSSKFSVLLGKPQSDVIKWMLGKYATNFGECENPTERA